jgi:two-component system phosphate regulon sensor histidine kinase PhoR
MTIAASSRLRLAPLWPAIAALLVVAATAALLLPGVLAEETARDLEQELQLVLPGLPAPSAVHAPDRELQRRLEEIARSTQFRLTIIALDGVVLADSDRSFEQLAEMENHSHRPEVVAALASGAGHSARHSDTIGLDTAYAARLVRGPVGEAWIARLARPVGSLATLRGHLVRSLLLSALVAAGAALAISWWLTRTLFRPLSGLIESAGRIGDGDYDARVAIPDPEELAALGHALARIASGAKRQLLAVEAERDHLSSTVASMADGVLVVDAAGQGQLANPAFHELFQLPANAPVGDLLDLAREPRLTDLIAAALRSRTSAALDIERLEPAPRSLALRATPLAGTGGAVVVARDLTNVERLNRIRKDFVANVSHELKTPLAAIRGYAESLEDGGLDEPETARRFVGRILEQCRRLGELLDDLLTLSRLEGREPIRSLDEVDLRDLASEAIELVTPRAAAKEIELALEPGPSPEIRGDAEGLLRLLVNLLDNAIKYNRPGGRVTVALDQSAGEVALTVTDTGIGIPPSHLPRIFERFYRVDSGRTREEGGTGLGLAIVKHVAQVHGGRVEVESESGRGSTFRVRLPTPA